MRTLLNSRFTGTVASHSMTLPDAPGSAGQGDGGAGGGPGNTFIKSVTGCLYAAANAVVTVNLTWLDLNNVVVQSITLGRVTNIASAAQVPFTFPAVNFTLEGGAYQSVSISANSSGAAQAHGFGATASHICAAFEHYSGELAGDKF